MPKNPDTLDTITAWLSHFWRETHTALKKYCLDSRRASVDLPARDELRLIDFEFGRLGHALMDGTYGRMIFPSCWCANRLPSRLVSKMEAVYRTELVKGCPEAQEDRIFERALVSVCGFWLFTEPLPLYPAFRERSFGQNIEGD